MIEVFTGRKRSTINITFMVDAFERMFDEAKLGGRENFAQRLIHRVGKIYCFPIRAIGIERVLAGGVNGDMVNNKGEK